MSSGGNQSASKVLFEGFFLSLQNKTSNEEKDHRHPPFKISSQIFYRLVDYTSAVVCCMNEGQVHYVERLDHSYKGTH